MLEQYTSDAHTRHLKGTYVTLLTRVTVTKHARRCLSYLVDPVLRASNPARQNPTT